MRSAFAVVAMLGNRLDKERTGWRDIKGLVLLVAQDGPHAWPAAASLADALGVHPDQQEQIYREAYPEPESDPAPAPERNHRDHDQPPGVHRHRVHEPWPAAG